MRDSIGRVGITVRKRAEVGGHIVQRGQQNALARFGQRQRVGEIVDVLGRAGEMDEFPGARSLRKRRNALLEPVLNCLDIVVGRALDRLDAHRVGRGEFHAYALQVYACRVGKRCHLYKQRFIGQCGKPRKLDAYTLAYQRIFAEVFAQRIDLGRVASVERRQCQECGVGHAKSLARDEAYAAVVRCALPAG